jgi:hypothetical protein
MATVVCTFRAGTIPRDRVRSVETALIRAYRDQLGSDRSVRVLWCELPAGQGFTAGKPSDLLYLMVEVDDGLDAARREAALHALAGALAAGASVPIEQLMVTVADRAVFARFLAAYRDRIRPRSRPWFWATTLVGLARSRRRDGYLALRANL